jgi:hypothetical protein
MRATYTKGVGSSMCLPLLTALCTLTYGHLSSLSMRPAILLFHTLAVRTLRSPASQLSWKLSTCFWAGTTYALSKIPILLLCLNNPIAVRLSLINLLLLISHASSSVLGLLEFGMAPPSLSYSLSSLKCG